MSDATLARSFKAGLQADQTPRIGRISQDADDVRQWAHQTRGLYGVPVHVFERALSCGGVQTRLWVAVIWPKGTAK